MAVPDAGCGWRRRGFSWQSQTLVVEAGVLISVSHPGSVGEAGVLMAVSDAGCVGERRGFHGSPICWLWG